MRTLLLGVCVAFGAVTNCVVLETRQILELPSSEVEKSLPSSHPMAYYLYSDRLAHGGDKARALFSHYVGELRYRFYLAVSPDLHPDGAPAFFASLHQSVGQRVADHKEVYRAASATEFKRALDWDATHENTVTSKNAHHQAWLKIRGDLSDELRVTDKIGDKQTARCESYNIDTETT